MCTTTYCMCIITAQQKRVDDNLNSVRIYVYICVPIKDALMKTKLVINKLNEISCKKKK